MDTTFIIIAWPFLLTTHLLSIEPAEWPKLREMFKAHDINTWQRAFPIGFPVEVCALNSLFFNIFMMILFVLNADARFKQNMSCWSINSFDFGLENFFPCKIELIFRPTRHGFLRGKLFSANRYDMIFLCGGPDDYTHSIRLFCHVCTPWCNGCLCHNTKK